MLVLYGKTQWNFIKKFLIREGKESYQLREDIWNNWKGVWIFWNKKYLSKRGGVPDPDQLYECLSPSLGHTGEFLLCLECRNIYSRDLPKDFRDTVHGLKVWQKFEIELLCVKNGKQEEPSQLARDIVRETGIFCTPCIDHADSPKPMLVEDATSDIQVHIFTKMNKVDSENVSNFLATLISDIRPGVGIKGKKAKKGKLIKQPKKHKLTYPSHLHEASGRYYRICKCGLHILKRLEKTSNQCASFSNHAGKDYVKCPGPQNLSKVPFLGLWKYSNDVRSSDQE